MELCWICAKFAPKFARKLKNQTVNETNTVELECQLSKSDKTVRWEKDGRPVVQDDRITAIADSHRHQLIIRDVTLEDAGNFWCFYGNASTACTLYVQDAAVEFTKNLQNLTVIEALTITLECQLSKPNKVTKWTKNDEHVLPDDRIDVIADELIHRLIIRDVTLEDAGEFCCICDNASTRCTLRVEELPLLFKTKLCDVNVNEKATIRLGCQLTKANKQVTWLKNGTEIPADDHLNITMDADTHQIVIPQADIDDAGQYSCVCADASSECTVTVEELPVEFKTRLCDVKVNEKETVRLGCQLTKANKPVAWLKDGIAITADNHLNITTDANTHQIVIPKADIDDAGQYSCVCGDASSECTVTVEELPVEFKTRLCDVKVNEKEAVRLGCQLTKANKPVAWLKDGIEITADNNLNITMDADTHQIVIPQADIDDAGQYSCVCGDTSSECTVTVEELPLLFKTKLCDVNVNEKATIRLGCQLTKANKQVTWLKNGTEIPADDHLNITMDADTHQIVIPQADIDDAGQYSCVCADASSECTVTVEELPVEFKTRLCDVKVNEKETVRLGCQLTKANKPVAWLKDGIAITADNHLNITTDANTHQIVIPKADIDDAGQYSCVCGDASSECTVTVEELPVEFKTRLCDVKVNEKEAVRLGCQLTKANKPVAWLKDGIEITADNNLNITMDADTHQIVIPQADIDDAGQYSCVCGDTSSECTVTVEELPVEFKTRLCDVKVNEKETVRLGCQLTKANKPVEWLKDGIEITADNNLNITMDADTHQIVIPQADIDDAGQYSCVCGDASSECTVTVEELPVEFKTRLCDVKVNEKETIMLGCQLTKANKPVAWLKYGIEITADNNLNITMDADTHQIVIPQADIDDAGQYSCVCGDASSECTVTVEELPVEFKTRLCDVKVIEKEAVRLGFQLTKANKPVAWLKDGIEITADDHLNITMDADTHQIVIPKADIDDAGQYSCVCGDASSECTVSVEELPVEFKTRLCDVKVIEKEVVRLGCQLTKANKPVAWLKDGIEITADDHVNVTMDTDTHQIVIPQADIDDAGQYSCVCGDASSECTVTVEELAPEFIKTLKNQTVPELETVTLECQLSKPNKTVLWTKNGNNVIPDNRITVTVGIYTHRCTIIDVTLEDAGNFGCECGNISTHCRLKVEELTTQSRLLNSENHCNWIKTSMSLNYLKEGVTEFSNDKAAEFHKVVAEKVHRQNPTLASSTCLNCTHKQAKRCKHMNTTTWRMDCKQNICSVWLKQILPYHIHLPFPDIKWKNCDPKLWPSDGWEIVKLFQPSGCQGQHRAEDCDAPGLLTLIKDCSFFSKLINDPTSIEKIKKARNVCMHSNDLEMTSTEMMNSLDMMVAFLEEPGIKNYRSAREAVVSIKELRDRPLDLSLNKELQLKTIRNKMTEIEHKMAQLTDTNTNLRDDINNMDTKHDTNMEGYRQKLEDFGNKFSDVTETLRTLEQSQDPNISSKVASLTKRVQDLEQANREVDAYYQPKLPTLEAQTHGLKSGVQELEEQQHDSGLSLAGVGKPLTELKPWFTKMLESQMVKETATVILECHLSKADMAVQWMQGVTEVCLSDRITVTAHTNTHQLTIRNVTLEDAGNFWCFCGDVSTDCTLTVEAFPVQFVKPLEDTQGYTNCNTTLSCELSHPNQTVTWTKYGQTLSGNRKLKMVSGIYTHQLIFSKLTQGEAGNYTCTCGDTSTAASLTVLDDDDKAARELELDRKSAEDVLKALLEKSAVLQQLTLQRVDLSSLGDQLSDILTLQHLMKLTLFNITLSREQCQNLGRHLRGSPKLRELSLRVISCTTHRQKSGCVEMDLGDPLRLHDITLIYLPFTRVVFNPEVLLRCVISLPDNVAGQVSTLQNLLAAKNLQRFECHNVSDEAAVSKLVDVLPQLQGLQQLTMWYIDFGSVTDIRLSPTMDQLESVDLGKSKFDTAGLECLLQQHNLPQRRVEIILRVATIRGEEDVISKIRHSQDTEVVGDSDVKYSKGEWKVGGFYFYTRK